MSLSAAASGFIVFLLSMPAVQGQHGWGVTYTPTHICALEGSSVEISCTYTYPSTAYSSVVKAFWSMKNSNWEPVDLRTDPEYMKRVQYYCEQNRCTARIINLRRSDSAVYKFRFITNQPVGKYTGVPGVHLDVTDLWVSIYSTSAHLKCQSRCQPPGRLSYVWYKNGQNIWRNTSIIVADKNFIDSYSCAFKGHEDLPSSPVCVIGENCNRVIYTHRNICALRGSSVDISCFYNSNGAIKSKFWFSLKQSHRWQNSSQPEDLGGDSQFAARVAVVDTERRYSTLRITNLTERDSAQYHFKFKSQWFEWRSSLPGTTLTVTDPDLQVRVRSSTSWPELECYSRCLLPNRPSYVWYKNGQDFEKDTPHIDPDYPVPKDSYSCAVKGYEDFPSPPECAVGQSCNRVTYTSRSICAAKGSSVDISCIYSSYKDHVESKFWFSPERSQQWQNSLQPQDISDDPQYAGRVHVIETEDGHSTLRITNLTERDSAQYHFKFKTQAFEWRSSLPGATLTVTALQVQVTRVTVHQSYTEAELKCLSSCSPSGHVSYVWFKNGKEVMKEGSSYEDCFNPGDIISCALKGYENHGSPPMYALDVPSVSVSPSGEIMEGSSVNLTCSSVANSAANYTWYKKNQTLLNKEPKLVLSSVQPSVSGEYYCAAENELGKRSSKYILIDVKYAPRPPTVSVSPSGEIVEGSSVTLTCSSDANPAADYTWYKEDEESPEASGQNFTITDIRHAHSGKYYCKAQNTRGHSTSTIYLTVPGAWTSTATGATTAVILPLISLVVFLLIRKKRTSKRSSEPAETPVSREQRLTNQSQREEQDDLHYASVRFSSKQRDCLYSNVRPAQPHRSMEEEGEGVVYSVVKCKSGSRTRGQETGEDSAALYSTINKIG